MNAESAEYVNGLPRAAQPAFVRLHALVSAALPDAVERFSYGMPGFAAEPGKRCRVFIAGASDHLAMYPVPDDPELLAELAPFRRGKGTLWFPLEGWPEDLVARTAVALFERG